MTTSTTDATLKSAAVEQLTNSFAYLESAGVLSAAESTALKDWVNGRIPHLPDPAGYFTVYKIFVYTVLILDKFEVPEEQILLGLLHVVEATVGAAHGGERSALGPAATGMAWVLLGIKS